MTITVLARGTGATERSMIGTSQILGVGASQPETSISAETLGLPFGRTAEWIRARTGIQSVRRIGASDDIGVHATHAAKDALGDAGLQRDDIDLVITVSCSLDHHRMAQLAAAMAPSAGWMAINAACSGFCFALSSADNFIRTGMAQQVLIVAIEQMSTMLDPEDLGTSIIFGDGAGAAVLGPAADGQQGIGPVAWGSDGERRDLIACKPNGGLAMAGQDVFRWAIESMPALGLAACESAGVDISDIEVFIPHQANARIIDTVAARLGLGDVVISRDIAHSGNASAASIPIAMTRLLAGNRRLSGRLALLLGFGAGLAYAGQVVRLP